MAYKITKMITGIDISDNILRILAVSKNRKNGITAVLDCAKLSSEEEKTVAKEIRSLLSKNKISNSRFIVSFPRHLVTVKNIKLPAASDSEIRSMAELQAIKYLPYSREEIVTSYKVISTTPEGYTDILLILAQKKIVDRYVNIFKLAGINMEKMGLSSEGILNWYLKLDREGSGSVAIIDIGIYHTHIQIVKDKNLVFSRSVSFDAGSAERDKGMLLKEVRLSFDTYLKEKSEGIADVIVSGGRNYTKIICDFLAANTATPCEIVSQADCLKAVGLGEQTLNKLKEYSYTDLFGFALSPDNTAINLIPYDIIERKRSEAVKKDLVKTAVLLLCIAVAFFAILEKKMLEKRFYLQKLDEKLKAIDPEVKRLSRVKESAELINGQLMFKGSSIDVIREIYKILPTDVSLTLLEFDDKDRLLLRGTARELSSVFNFLPILEKSPYFENAKINYATKRTFKQVEFADFEIVCQMDKF